MITVTLRGLIIASVFLTSAFVLPQDAQSPLARGKSLYRSALFEDALRSLNEVPPGAPNAELSEAAAYRAFCLIALGRSEDAKKAVEALVRLDPLYRPPPDFSPRILTFFDGARKPLLSAIVDETYDRGKASFDRNDMAAAVKEFERAITLIDEIGASGTYLDMRRLAVRFRDAAAPLAKAAAEAAAKAEAASKPPVSNPPVAAPPLASTAPAITPAPEASRPPATPDRVYVPGQEGVTAPQVLKRDVLIWDPPRNAGPTKWYGELELVIDQAGRVVSAKIVKSLHPEFDRIVLAAAPRWTYRPAMKDGKPVKCRIVIPLSR